MDSVLVRSDTTFIKKDTTIFVQDTIFPGRDTLPQNDTLPGKDSLGRPVVGDSFVVKMSKDTLDAPVNYEAEDSVVVLVQGKKIRMYGKTKTEYKDITLTAPQVEMDQQANMMTATADRDSTGAIGTRARFVQGSNDFQSDTIKFNPKTQKGLTKNTFTQQQEMFVQGEDVKKVGENTVFIRGGRFTTCNLDEPHFAFRTNKMKVIANKLAVSGPTHPEFEGVPVPIYLPFGLFPLSHGRHSGLLPPQFTVNDQYGLGLEGLGYYKVLNDHIDATIRGNIYSYGGWNANLTSSYRTRYRYNGAFNLSIQHTKFNFKGDPDYNLSKTFNITWNHSVDQRARPGTNFSANVNAGSTQYNRFVANNPNRNFQNQLGSSIAYSKTWAGKPYNLTLSANHSQNNNTRLINVILPDGSFTVQTLYPFQKKEAVGTPKWYEKLGVGYNGTFRNQLSFYDTADLSANRLLDTLQWGARHSLPITLSLPSLGPLLVSPFVSYEEVWLQRRSLLTFNDVTNKLDTFSQKGLYTDRQVSFGVGLNTNVFGTYQFKKARVAALRHVVRPTLSMNYRPDLSKSRWHEIYADSARQNKISYSEFSNNIFSGYSQGQFGGMSFGVDNSLEMKWRSKKDTTNGGIRKIRLIDGFGFTSGYNFLADTMQLQNFNLYLRSTLFEKINLNVSGLFIPYQLNQFGQPTRNYAWQGDKFSLGTLSYGSISMSTSFQSKKGQEDKQKAGQHGNAGRLPVETDPTLLADQQQLMDYMRRNPAEFVDFNIPWSINLSYSLNFNRRPKTDYTGFETDLNTNVSFSNSFNLTPKWNFSTNGYMNMKSLKLETFTMSISRDLHCWQMSISVTPLGLQRYFSFNINPKSGLLQDLKVNRTRTFSNY
ncbi:putative LPS assembly protein LptD [Paraflavisolibacter sp. H34]|uniref:putative LPS assembly protein LptD n=1 Tax=Huijunlia imazamoxiresistens TaxID=3127457 RepID=UPI0030175DC7